MASREVTIVVNDLKVFTERGMTVATTNIHANLVAAPSEGGTPVDTGWARANWVPSIGTPFEGLSGQRPRRGEQSRAGALAMNALARVALQYRIEQGPIWISNNVPYIGLLNNGTSKQAPEAFVQRAIEKGIRETEAFLR